MIKREHDDFISNMELGPPEESERAIQVVKRAFEARGFKGRQKDQASG